MKNNLILSFSYFFKPDENRAYQRDLKRKQLDEEKMKRVFEIIELKKRLRAMEVGDGKNE